MATGVHPDVSPELQRRFDDGHRFGRPSDRWPSVSSVKNCSAIIDLRSTACARLFVRRPDDERRHRLGTQDPEQGNLFPPVERGSSPSSTARQQPSGIRSRAASCSWRRTAPETALAAWYESQPKLRDQIIVTGWKRFAKRRCRLRPRGAGAGPGRRTDHGPPAVSVQTRAPGGSVQPFRLR